MSQQINLFDPALQVQHDPWSSRNLGLGVGLAVLLCALWGGWAHWQQANVAQALQVQEPALQAARTEAKQLAQQIASRQPDARLTLELADARQRLQSRSDVLALLKKGLFNESKSPAEWLRGFARQVPNGLWLTGFSVNADSGALEIHGRTTDPKLIPEYIRRLNAEKAFQGRTFAALEIAHADTPDDKSAVPAGAAAAAPAAGMKAAPTSAGSLRYHEFALGSAPIAPSNNGGRS